MSGPVIYGVRHLAPAAAHHLRAMLDAARPRPRLILVEGPSDLNDQMPWLCDARTQYPVAILAYTKQAPVRSLLYPFAVYSPEIQAILWAHEHGVPCRFMDLPSDVFLAFGDARQKREANAAAEGEPGNGAPADGDAPDGDAENGSTAEGNADGADPAGEVPADENIVGTNPASGNPANDTTDSSANQSSPSGVTTEDAYRTLELLSGEDHDSFWERTFEQVEDARLYHEAANAFGTQLRQSVRDDDLRTAETLVREAYMRRVIAAAIAGGVRPEEIFCVCGAFHVDGLQSGEPMTDAEAAALPHAGSAATLMPYSYFRLSSRSGYGAGNKAPRYFHTMWQALCEDGLASLSYRYFTGLAAAHRKAGSIVSSAEVIEAVRLAGTLAAMRGSQYPCLRDLRDAAVTTMGHGHFSELSVAFAATEIGTEIGLLPEGVSRTSVQEDFYRQLKALHLDRFRSSELQALDLDLRENLRVKSEQAAFLDLNRSFFLHRLRVLGVHFARLLPKRQDNANWGEYWELRWTPEIEIEVVEASLLGDSIESAAAIALKERAEESTTLPAAAAIFEDAFLCGMPAACRRALAVLQGLSIDAAGITDVAKTAVSLSLVVRYGDLRKFDARPVIPLLEQLYLRACLTLEEACVCDAKAAKGVTQAIEQLNALPLHHDFLDGARWVSLLERISDRDDLNTVCSGYAMATLLERGLADEALLNREVARRLSPGVPAELGAGWFEGLAAKNHYALLARLSLWRSLNDYLCELDEAAFRRALVFLRRAFADFSPSEKNDVAENLGEIWGLAAAPEAVRAAPTEAEQEILKELDDFSFDDI